MSNKFQLDQKFNTIYLILSVEMTGTTLCLNYGFFIATQSSVKDTTPSLQCWTDSQSYSSSLMKHYSLQRPLRGLNRSVSKAISATGNQSNSKDLAKLLQEWKDSSKVTEQKCDKCGSNYGKIKYCYWGGATMWSFGCCKGL